MGIEIFMLLSIVFFICLCLFWFVEFSSDVFGNIKAFFHQALFYIFVPFISIRLLNWFYYVIVDKVKKIVSIIILGATVVYLV